MNRVCAKGVPCSTVKALLAGLLSRGLGPTCEGFLRRAGVFKRLRAGILLNTVNEQIKYNFVKRQGTAPHCR